ncbi:PH domain-containing protein [Cellulomonas sp. SG140]|uniref:PH domain-containing protein n=1 Tax=Cellulomonas sp. SG140 TaxID=2976536 RepID=UPI0021E8C2FF|nr:PH domain-containing protein [Cellulomonas sp. SG140]
MSTAETPSVAGPAPVTAEAVGEDAYAWRRVHPITPLLRGWKALVAVLAIFAAQAGDNVRNLAHLLGGRTWLALIGVLVLVTVVSLVYSAFAWRAMRFAVTDEAVHLRQGIVFRQQRQARLDRLQAVDVVQPLLARLVGLSELRLEVAGGHGSAVSLSFLREDEADALRADLLALAAGLRRPSAPATVPAQPGGPVVDRLPGGPQHGAPPPDPAGAVTGPPPPSSPGRPGPAPVAVPAPAFAPAPEQQVYELPMPRLLGSILLSGGTVWLVLGVVAITVVIVVSESIDAAFGVLPAVLGAVSWVWSRLNGAATFRAAISPDGIRLRHGLTETRTQTVPPGRVQAVRLHQPLLWRSRDWWRVQINVAGYGTESKERENEAVLHPVATRQEAMTALWLVLPDLGVGDPQAVLDAAFTGRGDDGGFTPSPRAARWVDPIGWRRRGVLVTERALIVRSGRWWRSVEVVPHERTQSLAVRQGPIQRALGVATFVVHSTPGPVSPRAEHLTEQAAAALLDEQAARARHARRAAGPEQWMRRGTS